MFERFELAGFRGEVASRLRPADLAAALRLLTDPQNAAETIHWGRNYLYRTRIEGKDGPLEVVVKQFRNAGARARLDKKVRGSKAERSWKMACAFVAAGVPTAEPFCYAESAQEDGPSFFVTRYLEERIEARYLFRARADGRLAEEFPGLDWPLFLELLGRAIRKMHDAGLFHRDLSIGNVLLPRSLELRSPDDLALIDLNRARKRPGLGTIDRSRDLCRLAILPGEDRERFLSAYWGGPPKAWPSFLYDLFHRSFRFKIEGKKVVRAPFKKLGEWLRPRRAHAHIPQAPKEAGKRDKIVWDHLSDQPHQHAGRWDKLVVRLADAPSHLRNTALFLAASPRTYRRYRQLEEDLFRRSLPWQGAGIAVRPYEPAPEAVAQAVADLNLRHVLLRLHPWQEEHQAELELAAELHRQGRELVFALPQDRELVRRPQLWRRRIEELVTLFRPFGDTFVVGQAINRSKWGIWRYGEYRRLLREASEVMRQDPAIRIFGPGVIDFELHATAAVVNHPQTPRLDGLASLLYVDRRGAPENAQLGFDSPRKLALAKAIALEAKRCGPQSWVTEVNWPLWEGPHSPAGKSVSVDEEKQADYLARFYLLALASGVCERVYWWQAIARGYGLIAPGDPAGDQNGLRRRPSFQALATLERELAGATFEEKLSSPPGTWLLRFSHPDGEKVAAWSLAPASAELPNPATSASDRDGNELPPPAGTRVETGPGVRYYRR
jgi:tRNA A-37 threonylcarbamoyl transferase component Bud32